MNTAAQTERPFAFEDDEIRAIRSGRKTQHRWVIRNRARGADEIVWLENELFMPETGDRFTGWAARVYQLGALHLPLKAKFVIGERLWLQEAYAPNDDLEWHDVGATGFAYRADFAGMEDDARWIPAMQMPRSASRTSIEIIDVRPQRLHAITEADARAEGVEPAANTPVDCTYRRSFVRRWSARHFTTWESNPWVWATTLKLAEAAS